jgi:hypothetical protein
MYTENSDYYAFEMVVIENRGIEMKDILIE